MSFSLPRYITKRMFPAGKSLFLARKGDVPVPNYIMFRSINISLPLELPIPGMEQFQVEMIPNYARVMIDGHPLAITLERFRDDVEFWFQGKCIGYSYFEDIKTGKAENFVIPIGANTTLLLRIRDDIKYLTELGDHTFHVDIDFHGFIIKIEVSLNLVPENTDVKFDPALT